MFRQTETFWGGWQDKTLEAMQKRRFEQMVQQLPPLGAGRIENLSASALERKLERCWQHITRKPIRRQQEDEVWRIVTEGIAVHADCLSRDEHDLLERTLILGGCTKIEDMQELEAARALSMRLWGSIGLVSGRPYFEMEAPVLHPAAKAIAREAHEHIRMRFDAFYGYMCSVLYQAGVIDDRQPQKMILERVLNADQKDEAALQMARCYLWASFDCVDYNKGVLLVHDALADPGYLLTERRCKKGFLMPAEENVPLVTDILPEEIPLQQALERALDGAVRSHINVQAAAREIRFLCKQGAPLDAMEAVVQSFLIVKSTEAMRSALADMYYRMPKWMECSVSCALQ